MHSLRSSIQSVSLKRTSQQTQHQQQQITKSNTTNISSGTSTTSSLAAATATSTSSSTVQKSESILESLSEQHTISAQTSQVSSVMRAAQIKMGSKFTHHQLIGNDDSFDNGSHNSDEVFESGSSEDMPPALPVKTRKKSGSFRERHMSTYDNVEEAELAE